MTTDCLFCKIISKEIPAHIIHEDKHTIAFLDINPITKGHTLVIPKEHHTDFLSTPGNILAYITQTMNTVAKTQKEKLGNTALNIINNTGERAGQVVFHLHMHLIPRYDNDNAKVNIESKINNNDSIEEVYKQLTE